MCVMPSEATDSVNICISHSKLTMEISCLAIFHCVREVLDFLKGEPFSQFLESPYFTRYLQWKALEK